MALTLPSSNGASFHTTNRPNTIQFNNHFNGGLTQTTATVTPTRLKNIEETFLEHNSILPPKPVPHQHMAGFVTPSVNISLFVKPPANFSNNLNNLTLNQASHEASLSFKPSDYYTSSTTNSNSNDDSFGYSDEYSSEASQQSSSALENSNAALSFNNLIADMNNSSSSSGRGKKSSGTSVSKSRAKSNQSANMARSSQQKPKKSTGGGRKPTRNDKLSPEEEQKREKRRERNKLAAARCRKRRLDQTNTLMDRTSELEDEHADLVDTLEGLLAQMTNLKRHIEMHESMNCKKNIRLTAELFANLDFESLHEAMKPLVEEIDSESEMSVEQGVLAPMPAPKVKTEPISSMQQIPISLLSSSMAQTASVIVPNNNKSLADALQYQQQIQQQLQQPSSSSSSSFQMEPSTNGLTVPSFKQKRPKFLPLSNQAKPAATSEINLANNGNSSALQTPSGMMFGEFGSGTGLTPLMPTLTPSELTPSTMSAFIKSLASPMDEPDQKKLITI